MKIINLLVIVLIIMSYKANSQVHMVGIKNGINITNATSLNANYRIGNNYGFLYEVLFKDKYSISIDLFYNQRGYNDKLSFTNEIGELQPTIVLYSYSDYFSFPVKFGYTKGNNLKKFINLGLIPSLLIDSQSSSPVLDSDGNITGTIIYNSNNSFSNFDIGGLIELGLSYDVVEKINLFSSIMYSQSFNSFIENSINQNIRHSCFSLSLGVKYKI